MMDLITILTPTYNRADLLPRLYKSLLAQTSHHFEWLVVDDGSTDATQAYMQSILIENHPFPIYYYPKANGGKHTAVNFGVEKAQGALLFIADSDDMLAEDAIETVLSVWEGVKDKADCGGVCCLDGELHSGKVLGSGLTPTDKDIFITVKGEKLRAVDATSAELRYNYGVTGDMKEVFKTSVLKEFPFPEIAGERFCPEALVWHRIAQKYYLRYFDKVVYLAEYQEGGLSASITKVRMKSPLASMMTYQEMVLQPIPFTWRLRSAINYWRFRFCLKAKLKDQAYQPRLNTLWNFVMPLAWVLHLKDKRLL